LNLAEVDLRDLVEGLARDLREEAERAGVAVEVTGDFPSIVADEALLRQALRNLGQNAPGSFGGAAPQRNGWHAHRGMVRGGAGTGGRGGIRLLVEDNGSGIAAADLGRIFTPFFTTKEHGTGLGLALVQKTAVVHDGLVEVTSTPGQGTTFALVLPV